MLNFFVMYFYLLENRLLGVWVGVYLGVFIALGIIIVNPF